MFYPLLIEYEIFESKPLIKVFGRNEKGTKVTFEDDSFEPYFYAIPDQKNIDKAIKELEKLSVEYNEENIKIKRIEKVKKTDFREEITALKIFCNLPRDVSVLKEEVLKLKNVVHKREYDLPFAKRYCLDKQISFLSPYVVDEKKFSLQEGKKYEPSVAAFDIETYGTDFNPKNNQIICIGIYSEKGCKVFTWKKSKCSEAIVLKNEKGVLEKFFESITEFDILVSYNGDRFDLPFIKARAEELGVEHPVILMKNRESFRNLIHIDLYNVISKHLGAEIKTKNLKLDEVAKFLLGEGKKDLDIYSKGISKDIWDSNEIERIDEVINYNVQDCKITYLIAKKILPLEYRFSNLTGMNLIEVTRSGFSQLVENYLMGEAVKKNILIRNKPTDKNMEARLRETYAGGYVLEPTPGIYEDIQVLDFKSLYPTILVSHNISPDTVSDKGELEVKIGNRINRFDKKKQGFIVGVVKDLIARRAKIKKEVGSGVDEKALKTLANATYGYLGFFAARWYSKECAESITALGRSYIKDTIEKAERSGFKVIYGDTDSILVTGKEVKAFLEKINKSLPGIMELEYEGSYKRGIFVGSEKGGTKKRYALIDKEGYLEIKGFEFVRGDWSEIAKETQEKVLEYVLNARPEKAVEYVKEVLKEIKKGKIAKEKLIISRRLTKSIKEYEVMAPHVKVAKEMNRKGVKVGRGIYIPYVITPNGKTISERAIWAEEAKDYDADYYINHQVIPPAIRILSVLGYTKKDLLSEQSDLSKFS